ncbi:MAG TPA: class I SAM-dependent methyltransferase [bacterium]|nr:class I SAM-dependent methyltransferase [bacterium]
MRKEYLLKFKDQIEIWDEKWNTAEIEKEIYEAKNSPIADIIKIFLPSQGKILDVGCGLGGYLIWLKSEGFNIYGIDFSKEAIRRLKIYNPSLDVEISDCEALPFSDNYFDVYISLGVLEHIESGCLKALKEANRVLRDNGIVIISVPFLNLYRLIKDFFIFKLMGKESYVLTNVEEKNIVFYRRKLYKEEKKYSFFQYYFSLSEIRKLLKKSQFNIILWTPYSVLPGILEIKLFQKLYKKFILSKSKENLYKIKRIENSKKINNKSIKKRKFYFILAKRFYKLLSWEKSKNLLEKNILNIFRHIFGHMILIIGVKNDN